MPDGRAVPARLSFRCFFLSCSYPPELVSITFTVRAVESGRLGGRTLPDRETATRSQCYVRFFRAGPAFWPLPLLTTSLGLGFGRPYGYAISHRLQTVRQALSDRLCHLYS